MFISFSVEPQLHSKVYLEIVPVHLLGKY